MTDDEKEEIRNLIEAVGGSTPKTRYKELSAWLKIAVIGGWISIGYYAVAFIVGLIEGVMAL